MLRFFATALLVWSSFVASSLAQDTTSGDTTDTTATAGASASTSGDTTASGEGSTQLSDEQATVEETQAPGQAPSTSDPREDPQQTYYFIGAFIRAIFVPGFLQELFLDSATGAVNVALGAEFTYRKDNFDIVGQLWWAGYSNYGPYRASGDPDTDTEMIDSSLSVLFLSAAFLWSTPFNDVLALEYGVDVGIGVVLGNVYRTEAFPDAGGGQPRSTDGYAPCNAPGDGRNTTYCDGPSVPDGETGGHYNAKVRRWSDGGNLPNVVPWLAIPHLALRIKPVKQLMMRVEGGFGIGFFLGFSAAYGFQ